jgi:phosphoserine aminotransferase
MHRVYNFSPGPATLPSYVLERAKEDIFSFEGCGIGVMELSHRSPEFEGIITKTEELMRELLGIPKNYRVLFTIGGGTNQFSMLAMNLLKPGTQGNYLLSGHWAERAATEGKKFGEVHIAGSTKDIGYKSTPQLGPLSDNPAYLHFTSNNTIYGTQTRIEPDCPKDVPLLCDASSDILSRELDVSKYGLLYAAAQKNAGTAGVTFSIIREDLLQRSLPSLPSMMNYAQFAESRSLFNTAPTFSIYVSMRMLEWIKAEGGVKAMETLAEKRAKLVYDCIDRHELYVGYANKQSRSWMNVTLHLKDDSRINPFLEAAKKRELSGLAGYRSLGGLRFSLYNACTIEAVEKLVEFMDEFANLPA